MDRSRQHYNFEHLLPNKARDTPELITLVEVSKMNAHFHVQSGDSFLNGFLLQASHVNPTTKAITYMSFSVYFSVYPHLSVCLYLTIAVFHLCLFASGPSFLSSLICIIVCLSVCLSVSNHTVSSCFRSLLSLCSDLSGRLSVTDFSCLTFLRSTCNDNNVSHVWC